MAEQHQQFLKSQARGKHASDIRKLDMAVAKEKGITLAEAKALREAEAAAVVDGSQGTGS